MRIVYHQRTQAEDAQGIHIYEIINAFKKLGHSVDQVSLVEIDSDRKKKKGKGWGKIVKYVPNFFYELLEIAYNFVGYWLLVKHVQHKRPDFIYERYSLNTFCGIWVSKKYNIPLLLEVNAPLYYEQKKYGKLTFIKFAEFSERWICSNSTKTITVSASMKNVLVEEGVPEQHIVVIPNGINPDDFNPYISGDKIRNRYEIPVNMIICGFVGWFRQWHGLDGLIKSFNKAEFRDRCVVILVGDGPEMANLQEIVKDLDLVRSVIFTGPVQRENIAEYIASFDIALQPNVTKYASPMKIIEYLAMGKPVIAPDQDNIREILTHGKDSLLFKSADYDDMLKKLNTVVENKSELEKLSKGALRTIKEKKMYWIENAKNAIDLLE